MAKVAAVVARAVAVVVAERVVAERAAALRRTHRAPPATLPVAVGAITPLRSRKTLTELGNEVRFLRRRAPQWKGGADGCGSRRTRLRVAALPVFYQCPLSAGSALTRLRRLRPQIAHLTFVRSLRGRQTPAILGPTLHRLYFFLSAANA
ncbi:MAG: hypothetical protein IPK82_38390 [Polyangiaceae bacterium]|nr:hypothetical protein [Polyangiaceae bacterium]